MLLSTKKGGQMKKSHLKKIALLGISAGTLATSSISAAQHHGNTNSVIAENVVFTDKPMTEVDLQKTLNADTKSLYDSLSTEGKVLALKLANQIDKPFTDKNDAVKAAAQRMEDKSQPVEKRK